MSGNTGPPTLQQRIDSLERRLRRFGLLSAQTSQDKGGGFWTPRRPPTLQVQARSCSMPPARDGQCATSPLPRRIASPMSAPRGNNMQLNFDRPRERGIINTPSTSSQNEGRNRQSLGTPLATPSPATPDSTYRQQLEQERRQPGKLKLKRCIDGEITYEEVEFTAADLVQVADLGHGTCGQVLKMKLKDHQDEIILNRTMAVKQMRMTSHADEMRRVFRDLSVAKDPKARHVHIVEFYGYLFSDIELWICMELMSTCFGKIVAEFEKLRNQGGYDEQALHVPEHIVGQVAVAVVEALHHMKTQLMLVHRDVKPSNILIDRDGHIKMCDFGIAATLENSVVQSVDNKGRGCAAYMAPERFDAANNAAKYGTRTADVWSFGVTVVELVTGRHPFQASSWFATTTLIVNEPPPRLHTEDGHSPELCDLVAQCLNKEASKRPNYEQLLNHDFVKKHMEVRDSGNGRRQVADWFATLGMPDGKHE